MKNILRTSHFHLGLASILGVLLGIMTIGLWGQTASAQQDTVLVRAWYHVKFRKTAERNLTKDVAILDIGKIRRNFYSELGHKRILAFDSLKKVGVSRDEFIAEMYKYDPSKFKYEIYTNFPKIGQSTFIYTLSKMRYTEEQEVPQWTLMQDTMSIIGHHCMTAETMFRGRKWKAYYAPDIPIDAGPWKLCGLPGLILKAEEATGDFSFECIGIGEGHDEPLYIPGLKKYIKCTPEEIRNDRARMYKDFVGYMKERGIDATKGWYPDGTPIKYSPETAVFFEVPQSNCSK